MSNPLYEWIRDISILSPLVPLLCLFVYWKRQPKQNMILAISLFISFVFDVIAWSSTVVNWHEPKFVCISNNLYCIISFPAIMLFYHETLVKRSLKILVRIFTVSFLVVALIFAFEQGLKAPNYSTWMLSSILIATTSLFFIADLNLMDQSNFVKNQFHKTNIVLNTSLAVYYFVAIVMFALNDYVSHTSDADFRYFWSFHNLVNTGKHLGIAVAFYLSAKHTLVLSNLQISTLRKLRH